MTRKILKVTFALLFILSFAGMVILKQYFVFERPQSVEPQSGRIFPVLANYNKTVFVTNEEKRWLNLTYLGMVVGGGLCIALMFIPISKNPEITNASGKI
jgi:hypothetical protein